LARCNGLNDLPEDMRRLVQAALRVLGNSYAPYSNVHVAAAVLDEQGRVHLGVNVENASYGLTICAERNAVAAMVTAGGRRVKAVAVVSDMPEPLPPCGACRQVLAEFAGPETPVASYSARSGKACLWTLGELLPYAFTASHIEEAARGAREAPGTGRG
jgi:cytidine deaminase